MFKKAAAISVLAFALTLNLFPQGFVEQPTSLLNVHQGSLEWGDYDNDNDPDILLTGYSSAGYISKVYKNTGGAFVDQTSIILTGVYQSAASWGDYDKDGYLDILLTGTSTTGPVSKIYKNNGNETFTEQTSISLTGVYQGSAAWGDYDNDGDLDIALAGISSSGPVSKVYQNNGNNSFTEQNPFQLGAAPINSMVWGDYDNDGDLDILLSGGPSYVFKNNGNGTFTNQAGTINLPALSNTAAAWGDYNNDGFLDILLTGSNLSKVFKNNGNGTFTDQGSISLTGISYGSVKWGDYDNDGYLDIILTGVSGSGYISKIYKNNGNDTFSESFSLIGVQYSSAAWGDYDSDSKLDILLSGLSNMGPITKVYKNINPVTNTIPNAPSNLSASVNGNNVTLNWNKSTDNQTPQNGLHYNLVIGTVSNGIDKVSPMANRSTGYRRIIRLGNSQTNSWTIKNLPSGTFYWSVQTVDGAFAGSQFSSEGSFTISLPQFTEQTSISLIGVAQSSVSWGDYDNDGDLDILLSGDAGSPLSRVYKNNGDNTFTFQSSIFLQELYSSSAAWGDYDNDGDLDILLTGRTYGGQPLSIIYRNNGDNTFSFLTFLTGVCQGSAAWGDYNSDGFLDILLTGIAQDGYPSSKIFKNNGNSTFSEQASSLIGVYQGSAAWGDYDNDGDPDIVLTGMSLSYGPVSKIYKNNGDNTFTEQTSIPLIGWYNNTVAWGDYDNDGNLDLLLVGPDVVRIYKNYGNNTFSVVYGLINLSYCSAAWGDYDNDGDLDILLAGNSGSAPVSKIFKNNGNNTFSDQPSISLTGVRMSSAAWGDYDNDGDLDIVLTGHTGSSYISKVYRNNNPAANSLPSAPGNLSAAINGNDVTFSWNKSTDSQTPQNGLHYNLVIGTTPNGVDKLSPMSNRSTGFRKVVRFGNSKTNSFRIKNLPDGEYYWSVQAIDNNFAGSAFSGEQSFTKPVQFTEQTSIVMTGAFAGAVKWGDYDNDGDLDILVTGYEEADEPISALYRNNGDNTFTEQTSVSLAGLSGSSADWGDFDNDGDLDIIMCGYDQNIFAVTKIYQNLGNNSFAELASASLKGLGDGSVEWGDYDNDGLIDILLTGTDSSNPFTKIYHNNGDNTFTEQTSFSLINVSGSSGIWGDYDNDGDLDILLTGFDGTNRVSRIYRNEAGNSFSEQTSIALTDVRSSAAAWGDYDNDGDLDIVLTGNAISGCISKVYRNEGSNSFIEQGTILLTGIYSGSAAWGDYNNDGDLDILLTGDDGINPRSIIYKNNGNNTFTALTSISLAPARLSSAAWGDYDNDGDLDLVLSGHAGPSSVTKIYRNNAFTPNNIPAAPVNLTSSVNGHEVTVKWDKSTDAETPQNGLKYNLVIGTNPNAFNILSPMSDRSGGFRRVLNLGNTNHDTSWTIRELSDGNYYWSVQAIDNEFAGSQFADEESFEIGGIAEEPAVQASNVLFSSIGTNGLTVSWTNGSGESRIVLMKSGSAVDTVPLDGISYGADSVFRSGSEIGTGNYVVYSGTGNSVTVTGLDPGTIYHVAVFEYNGSNNSVNYLIASPAGGSETTAVPGTAPVVVYWGNSSNQYAYDIISDENNIYLTGSDGSNNSALILSYPIPLSENPSWNAAWQPGGGSEEGCTIGLSGSNVYIAGCSWDLTVDNSGGKEHKSIFAKFIPPAAVHSWYKTPNAIMPYSGFETFKSAAVSGSNTYVIGNAEESGWGNDAITLFSYTDNGEDAVENWRYTISGGSGRVSEEGTGIILNGSTLFGCASIEYSGGTAMLISSHDPSNGTEKASRIIYRPVTGKNARAYGITSDESGNIYLCGKTDGGENGGFDAVIAKFNSEGILQWSTQWGGADEDWGKKIIYSNNELYVLANTKSFGSGQTDMAILKINPSNGAVVYNDFWGGSSDDIGTGITVKSNYIYVTGYTSSFGSGGTDVVILQYDASSFPFAAAKFNAKVFLQGNYQGGQLTTDLISLPSFPLQQPFNTGPWNYAGAEVVSTLPPNISDWILVELRTGPDSSGSAVRKAAFIKNDGTITDLDGTSQVQFPGVSAGNYYLVIHHRNHLSIMSSNTSYLSFSSSPLYDFTTGQDKAYGGSSMIDLGDNKFGMISGDANGDGNVDYNYDVLVHWLPNFGMDGYYPADFNMDGTVDYEDDLLIKWLPNFGYSSPITHYLKPEFKLKPIIKIEQHN